MAAITYRGIVKGNIVILESAVSLPEGTEVEVRLLEPRCDLAKRKTAVAKLKALGRD